MNVKKDCLLPVCSQTAGCLIASAFTNNGRMDETAAAGCSGSQTDSCTLTRAGGRAHYLCSRTGVVLQQRLSWCRLWCSSCVIANVCRMLTEVNWWCSQVHEPLTLSPASVKGSNVWALKPSHWAAGGKKLRPNYKQTFYGHVCPVSVDPGPLTFINNLIALTPHWVVLLLPLLSSLCAAPPIISWILWKTHQTFSFCHRMNPASL